MYEDGNRQLIPIVFTSSSYYAPYMAVTMQSVIESSSKDYDYEFIVLHKEIDAKYQAKLRNQLAGRNNFNIRFIEVQKALDSQKFNFREGYSSESFYRVVMVDILRDFSKVVYLDSDLVVREDLARLYLDTELEDNLVAAAIDIDGLASAFSNHDGRKEYMISYLGIEDLHDYLQSGVMIFNLEEWRKSFTLQEIVDAACDDEVMFGDQDVLNKLCRGRIKFIDMSWNTIINHRKQQMQELLYLAPTDVLDMYLCARKNPKIVHYGGTKPWDVPDCDMAYYFWETARKTMFYEDIIGRNVKGFKRYGYEF